MSWSEGRSGPGPGRVLQLITSGRAQTRTAIARATGLGRSTVLQRLDALFTSGLIVESAEREASGGRPSTVLRLNERAGLLAAVDVGEKRTRVVIADLGRRVVAEDVLQLELSDGPPAVLDEIARAVRRLAPGDHAPLVGIGLGLPAPVDYHAGMVVGWSIMSGWDGFDIRAHLRTMFDLPVLIDNDVNLLTVAEHRRHWPDEQHLLYVKAGTGIGSGQIVGGRVNRGARGAAGDIGHVRINGYGDPLCRCGNLGCLEALAGGWAVARDLRRSHGVDVHDARGVMAEIQLGNAHASARLREAGRALGEALAHATSLLNPSVIVLGGTLASSGDHLLAGVRQLIYQNSLPLATRDMRIVPTGFRGRAGVAGATYLLLDHLLEPARIDAVVSGAAPASFTTVPSSSTA